MLLASLGFRREVPKTLFPPIEFSSSSRYSAEDLGTFFLNPPGTGLAPPSAKTCIPKPLSVFPSHSRSLALSLTLARTLLRSLARSLSRLLS